MGLSPVNDLAKDYTSLRERLVEVVPKREAFFTTDGTLASVTFKALCDENRDLLLALTNIYRANVRLRHLIGDTMFSTNTIGHILVDSQPATHAHYLRRFEEFFSSIVRGVNPQLKKLCTLLKNQSKKDDAGSIAHQEQQIRSVATYIAKIAAPYQELQTMTHQEAPGTAVDQEVANPGKFVHDPRRSLWVIVVMIGEIEVFLYAIEKIRQERDELFRLTSTRLALEAGHGTSARGSQARPPTAVNDYRVGSSLPASQSSPPNVFIEKVMKEGYLLAYRLHNIQLPDGLYDLDWSADLLDGRKRKKQEKWLAEGGKYLGEPFLVPTGPEFRATIAALNLHHDAVTNEFAALLKGSLTERSLMTGTRVDHPPQVYDELATPEARIDRVSHRGKTTGTMELGINREYPNEGVQASLRDSFVSIQDGTAEEFRVTDRLVRQEDAATLLALMGESNVRLLVDDIRIFYGTGTGIYRPKIVSFYTHYALVLNREDSTGGFCICVDEDGAHSAIGVVARKIR